MDLGRGFSQYRAAHEHFEPHSGCDMWEELAGETETRISLHDLLFVVVQMIVSACRPRKAEEVTGWLTG